MSTIELKQEILELVRATDDAEFLRTIRIMLLKRESPPKDNFWDSLSESQQMEILQAYYESFDPDQRISFEDFQSRM